MVQLPDHSILTLNSGSAVKLHYDRTQRRIDLPAGEVLVQVAHIADPAQQPFIVTTADGSARALGTRYLVRREPGGTLVTVLESSVQATSADGKMSRSVLPGQRVAVTNDAVSAPQTLDAEQAASWVRGRLVADNTPLPEVLATLSDYRPGMLRYDAAQLKQLSVSGEADLRSGLHNGDDLDWHVAQSVAGGNEQVFGRLGIVYGKTGAPASRPASTRCTARPTGASARACHCPAACGASAPISTSPTLCRPRSSA